MQDRFIPKRSHKKSRAGCKTCKLRKIKCDEVQPTCSNCSLRNIPCHYIPAQRPAESSHSGPDSQELISQKVNFLRSPTFEANTNLILSWIDTRTLNPPVISSAGSLSTIDLRLMHQWSTSTFSTIIAGGKPDSRLFLQQRVPELAFENDFLMYGVLGIASLHMQCLFPNSEQFRKQTSIYRSAALREFRLVLNSFIPNSQNQDAAVVMSMLLIILCSQDYPASDDELTVIRWLTLFRGFSDLAFLTYPARMEGTISAICRRKISELRSSPLVPTTLLNMMGSVDPTDPDRQGIKSYCEILDALGTLYASLGEDGLGHALFIRVISWCSYASAEFAAFAREKRPRALVILAHYLSFLKLVPGTWWVEGVSNKEIRDIERIIDPEWLRFMEIPLQVVNIDDPREIAILLLR